MGFYKSITGFQEYYLVEQSKKIVVQYIINSKGNWELTEHKNPEGTFSLPSLNIDITMSEIYEGVDIEKP